MNKVHFSVFLLLMSGCRSVGITAEVIEGVVSNSENIPIANAHVVLDDYFEVTTNGEGYFCLEELMSPPDIAIRVDAMGYNPLISVLDHGDFSVSITLENGPIKESQLKASELTDDVPFYCSSRSKGSE